MRKFFHQTLVGQVLDGVLTVTLQKPKMGKLYEKMDKGFKELEYAAVRFACPTHTVA